MSTIKKDKIKSLITLIEALPEVCIDELVEYTVTMTQEVCEEIDEEVANFHKVLDAL